MPKSCRRTSARSSISSPNCIKTKRVSDKNYKRIHALFGDAGTVEFVGIVGYYTTIAMTLNVFHVPLPEGQTLPFSEQLRYV